MRLLRLADLSERRISGLPEGARITNLRWSPDGSRFAFTNVRPDGVELWVAESATAEARRLAGGLNLTASTQPAWLADGRTLVCTLVDPDLGPEPQASEVPTGPVIRDSSGHAAPARTFQDLLKSASDEALFEHYLTSRVAKVTLDGKVTPIGAPGLVAELSPSPDGRYLLVQSIHRPFSYLVPADRFPRKIEVWDLDGKAVRTVADLPLQEEIPISFDSVATGPRAVSWREDAPSTLFWVEALDGGDAGREAAERDRALLLPAPFQGEPATLANLGFRFYGITWGNDNLALLSEGWFKTRKTRTWIVQPGGKTAPGPPLRPLLGGPLQRSRLVADHPGCPGPGGFADRRRRPHDLHGRRGRLHRRGPAVPRRPRSHDQEDPPALPLRGALLRDPHRSARRRRQAAPASAGRRWTRRPTTTSATSPAASSASSPASRIRRRSSPASTRS